MSKAIRKFQDGLNYYVPNMQAGSDQGQALKERFSLGTPALAVAAGLLSAQSIAAAVDTTTFVVTSFTDIIMGRFGRVLTVVASGAATSNVTVYGRDYLGQKMAESFTLNGTTPVVGKKAFKYVDRVTAGITGGTTINLGYGAGLGLPYVTTKVNAEWSNNVVAAAGTLIAPIFTDPQTLTTGDPRGTYTTTTTLDGAKAIEIEAEFSNFVNTPTASSPNGNGGMHGIKHVVA